jgi:hypothetical protein
MTITTLRSAFGLLCLAALAACGSIDLIELNNNFTQLSQQSAEAERSLRDNEIDRVQYETLVEVNRVSFEENGDKAVEAADEAATLRQQVSFLNLAVRSYLNAGAPADTKIPDLAEQGIELCADEDLQGLNALPVTCGYFHIVSAQAVSNESLRDLDALAVKAAANPPGSGPPLSAEDAAVLQRAFNRFLAQIGEIDKAAAEIDLANADPQLAVAIERQKVIFYCNAFDALARYGDTPPTGPDWDRAAALSADKTTLDSTRQALGIADPFSACGQ